MATLQDVASELVGMVPGYSRLKAIKDVQRALVNIFQARCWSFLIADDGFNAPPLIQSGSVAITTGFPQIIFDVTADALLAAVPATQLNQWQFRIAAAGELYNIVSYTTATRTMVLDRPILEPTNAAATYMVYQCYFPPPPQAMAGQSSGSFDFNRWISVVDPINGFRLKIAFGKSLLDRRDPQRSTSSLAYQIYDYKTKADGTPLYEFWPHPTSGQTFICLYKKAGLAWIQQNAPFPEMIPDSLVLNRTLAYAVYPWAAMNAARQPLLKHANWSWLIRDAKQSYEKDLQAAKLEDDNVNLQSMITPERAGNFPPIDSSFLQGHSTGLEPYR